MARRGRIKSFIGRARHRLSISDLALSRLVRSGRLRSKQFYGKLVVVRAGRIQSWMRRGLSGMVGIDMSWVGAGQKRSEVLGFGLGRVRAGWGTVGVVKFGLG